MRAFCILFLILCSSAFSEAFVIGIAGASGAGKTTLARKLAASLGDQAVIISQDSYYRDLSHLPIEERAAVNFDHPGSIDFELMREQMLALKEGKDVELPVYDFKIHSRSKETKKVQARKIIIVEGCLLFAVPDVCKLCDIIPKLIQKLVLGERESFRNSSILSDPIFLILGHLRSANYGALAPPKIQFLNEFRYRLFLDVDLDVCLCRRIERDQKERGRTFPDIQKQYFSSVRPMFLEFIAPSKLHADMIIPTHRENELVLDFIASKLGSYHLKTG